MEVYCIIMRKLRKVWVGRPKPITIVRVGSGRPRPIMPRGLGRSTQTHHHSEGWIWTTKAHHATRFGSVYPNRLQGLDRATQIGCKVWIKRPKPAARLGSSDPNWLQGLGRSTQTGCKIWVEQYESSKDFYLSKFIHGFQGSGMSNLHRKYNTSQ
jgi:hypothetical protein